MNAVLEDATLQGGHLAALSVRALARNAKQELIVDYTRERRSLSAGKLLAVSYALAQRLKVKIAEKRVGIALPPGIGGYVSNLAVALAGKVPVNLNITAGPEAGRAALQRAGIRTILTVPEIQKRFPDFPWTAFTLHLSGELVRLSKGYLCWLLVMIWGLPSRWLPLLLGVRRGSDQEEAALLFTSGSSGTPKGVVLTHRNLIANVLQIKACGLLNQRETLLASLPLFHSFGFTVTLWYPLLTGLKTVTVSSPLQVKKICHAIAQEKATLLVGTPTFFRSYLKKGTAEALRTLKFVVAGSEKTPEGFHARWEAHFGSRYLEGYGLTETSPAAAINLPTVEGYRLGSVGRLFPGMAARVVDPESGKVLPSGATGLLYLKGPNVFKGYLDDPERTAKVFEGEWFITGDLARLDQEGFVYIEGRLSRFSKIAGEMVPHGTVEQAIIDAFDLEDTGQHVIAVTARVDPAKGEMLVLLTTCPIDPQALRSRLTKAGLSNLWIPRVICLIEHIPILPTGKLDLKACSQRAQNSAA